MRKNFGTLMHVNLGVPQGSTLEPIFVNPLFIDAIYNSISAFADDKSSLVRLNQELSIQYAANKALKELTDWF